MKQLFVALFLIACGVTTNGQSVNLNGKLDALKGQKEIMVEYTYNDMKVGKMTETEYVNKKVSEYNAKEAGRGDKWKGDWVADRTGRFEPQFEELFNEYSNNIKITEKAKTGYTLQVNTDFTEPGFNVYAVKKRAKIDLTVRVIENATKKEIATIEIKNSPGRDVMGYDYDTGSRIQEAYAKAGKELGKLFNKKI